MEKFIDRHHAGKLLAKQLNAYANQKNLLVLGLPRGGVPIAYEVSKALSAPLDVFIVRKLGVPGHEELALGAIASGGSVSFNEDIVRALDLEKNAIDEVIQSEKIELARREKLYRAGLAPQSFSDKTIILVDDGIATGATIHVAIEALRQHKPAALIVAVPTASYETCQALRPLVDDFISLLEPIEFYAVGLWYENFSQTTDKEVIELLKAASSTALSNPQGSKTLPPNTEHAIKIPCDNIELNGILYLPENLCGFVLFVHGSGSSRLSTRNQQVAHILNQANIGTLLFDLLTPEEEILDNQTAELRFDIKLLSTRLMGVTNWCLHQQNLEGLSFGYFGASTGGAAAVIAASKQANLVDAVVSRGGRPDLAGKDALTQLQTPTLLIVGEQDEVVLELNQAAMSHINCTKKLEIVPHATHLFEEPGALDKVAVLAKNWFLQYLH